MYIVIVIERYLNNNVIKTFDSLDDILKAYSVYSYSFKPYISDIESGKQVEVQYSDYTTLKIQKILI